MICLFLFLFFIYVGAVFLVVRMFIVQGVFIARSSILFGKAGMHLDFFFVYKIWRITLILWIVSGVWWITLGR